MEQINQPEDSFNAAVLSLLEKNNLGNVMTTSILDGGGSSSHDNYLVQTTAGKCVLRVVKDSGALNHTNLEDEYKILQLLESCEVGPKSIAYDTLFGKPALLETYIEGTIASSETFSLEYIDSCIELMTRVGSAKVKEDEFPFVFRYPSYEVSFPVWEERIDVVRAAAPDSAQLLDTITTQAAELLAPKDELLRALPQSFIYNDVHPGNLIFESATGKAKFVDWQKVSLGDPTFMIVLFGERFASVFGMEKEAFREKVQDLYEKRNAVPHFKALYAGRAYERAVSDLVWTAWVKARKGEAIDMSDQTFQNLSQNVAYWEGENNN